MSLPKGSRNQDLETLSKRVFEPLFDTERFALKTEYIDNGIDYRCEIKYKGNITGFGFNFQLKSRDHSQPNKLDGSHSKSLNLSNIEYLLNNGQPAFYGFYIEEDKSFYYEHLDEFIFQLEKENPLWQEQENHTLRFIKKIDKKAIDSIYNIALLKGKMLRKINSYLATRLSKSNLGEKILIDYDSNVTTDEELKEIIEKYGFGLVNQCEWNKVLALHSKTSNSMINSAKYNMIIGLANYYKGEYYTSLSFLKKGLKNRDELGLELQNHLIFINTSVKLLLNIINQDEYDLTTNSLPEDNHIKFHIQIEKAIEDFKNKLSNTSGFIDVDFENTMNSIIKNKKSSNHVKFRAKSELLIYQSRVIIQKHMVNIFRINAYEGINQNLRIEFIENFDSDLKTNKNDFNQLLKEAKDYNNYFSFYYLYTFDIKFNFEKLSTFKLLNFEVNPFNMDSFEINFKSLFKRIDMCISYFENIGHLENILFSKSIKYEMLHYSKKYNKAKELMEKMEELVNLLDIKKTSNQLNFIKHGGTNHQELQKILRQSLRNKEKK